MQAPPPPLPYLELGCRYGTTLSEGRAELVELFDRVSREQTPLWRAFGAVPG
jgi:hypothetical protein